MDVEKESAEKCLGVKENHATDVSDEGENTTAAPSVTAIEEDHKGSSRMPRHDVFDKDMETSRPLTAASESGIPTPPNGGLAAWLQVLGGFFVYFNTWLVNKSRTENDASTRPKPKLTLPFRGLIITFGVFQAYYETHLLNQYSPSSISWIGTVQGFLLIEVGIFAGPLYDQGHLRYLLLAGAFLVAFGLMMASLATEFYSIFLSLGVCSGLGMGLLFFPAISAISTYWTTRRGMANGIAASGSAVG